MNPRTPGLPDPGDPTPRPPGPESELPPEPAAVDEGKLDDGQLDEAELDEQDLELSSRLRSLLDPSADFRDRTALDVDRTLRGRSVLASGLDLLGLGVWTARALLSDAPPPADQDLEGI